MYGNLAFRWRQSYSTVYRPGHKTEAYTIHDTFAVIWEYFSPIRGLAVSDQIRSFQTSIGYFQLSPYPRELQHNAVKSNEMIS